MPDSCATLAKSSVEPGPLGPTGPRGPAGPRLNAEVGSSSGCSLGGTGFNVGHGSSGTNMFSQARGPMTLFHTA